MEGIKSEMYFTSFARGARRGRMFRKERFSWQFTAFQTSTEVAYDFYVCGLESHCSYCVAVNFERIVGRSDTDSSGLRKESGGCMGGRGLLGRSATATYHTICARRRGNI